MFCAKCGKPIAENMRFCAGCGTPVNPSSVPPEAQQETREFTQLSGNPAVRSQPPREYTTLPPQRPPQPMPPQPPVQQQMQPPAAPPPQKKKPKAKKKSNIGLRITAAVLVIAVLAAGVYSAIFGIKNKNETEGEGVLYIDDFPILKGETDFQVYDAEKFPAEEYEIKVERFHIGGALKDFSSKTELFKEISSNRIYKLKLDDGSYRITLKDITSSRTHAVPSTQETVSTTGSTTITTTTTTAPSTSPNANKTVVVVIIIDIVVDNDNPEAVDKVDLNWGDKTQPTTEPTTTETTTSADDRRFYGKVSKVSDHSAGISGATIKIYNGSSHISTITTDPSGNYAIVLPEGTYRAEVSCTGYKDLELNFDMVAGSDTSQEIYLESVPTGTLAGKICKASDRVTAIPGASITVYKGTESVLTAVSDTSGNYSVNLPEGDYSVKITSSGYIEFNSYATVTVNQTVYMETFLLIAGSVNETGTATGTIFNSLTKEGVSGVTLTVKKDWNNTSGSGSTVKTATTDSSGNYTLSLPLGNYTVIATKDGFSSSSFNIVVQKTATDNQNGTITPVISGNDYLITLTWDENPYDLDAHLYNKSPSGTEQHIYFDVREGYENGKMVCQLDYDDIDSYGPEHITLTTTNGKPYYFFVHHFEGQGTLASSGAKVTIEQGNRLIAEYNVPASGGDGVIWNVFAIKDGQIITKNTITNNIDVNYAN